MDSALTPREDEVLKLIASGLSTKQIALSLGISFKTAACHRSRLMDKLGIHEVAGLTRHAVERGIVGSSRFSGLTQERLFDAVTLAHSDYKQATRAYNAFIGHREGMELSNPDGSLLARKLRLAETEAHDKYHAALVALREFLLPEQS
ncbi:MAG TPA: helix-turn-helix transcriptional regulator [Bryobacteraceae bacterium]|jgi:DNA-binding CsgD family transcriptional regulator